jgi:hypothetical protein
MIRKFEVEKRINNFIVNKFIPNKITINQFYKTIVFNKGIFYLLTDKMLDSSYYDSEIKSLLLIKE